MDCKKKQQKNNNTTDHNNMIHFSVKPETSKHRNDIYISWWINLDLGMR